MTEAIENSVQPVMEHVASTIAEHAGEAAHVAHVAHGHGPFYHDPTVITSYSIHYTKLYEFPSIARIGCRGSFKHELEIF